MKNLYFNLKRNQIVNTFLGLGLSFALFISMPKNAMAQCTPSAIPYTMPLSSVTPPAIPTCDSLETIIGNAWVTDSAPGYGFNYKTLVFKASATTANSWIFSNGLSLNAGWQYKLSFRYGNSQALSNEALTVAYGMDNDSSAMTTLLFDSTGIFGAIPHDTTIVFTATATGTFYLGFQAHYGTALLDSLFIDSIGVTFGSNCFAPTNVTTSDTTGNTATLAWTAANPLPANGYAIYYSTSNTAPTAMTIPLDSVAAGVTTTILTSLATHTKYYAWVRSKCSSTTNSGWSAVDSFMTYCGVDTVPFYMPLNSVTIPALPYCASTDTTDSNRWVTAYAPGSGFNNNTLVYNADNQIANSWVFTSGIKLHAGWQYILNFRYGNSSTTKTEKLLVAFGADPYPNAMPNLLFTNVNITGATPTDTSIKFSPASTGTYYIGFQSFSDPNQSSIYIDSVSVILGTNCFAPSNVTATNITTSSAIINWTASTSNPSDGYDIYYSTTNMTPDSAAVALDSVATGITTDTLNGLTAGTTYYVWVRSKCSVTFKSTWSSVGYFTTGCQLGSIPYFMPINTAITPNIPNCTSRETISGSPWVTTIAPGLGFNNKNALEYVGNSSAANSWIYTNGIPLTAGTTYRISFRYGNGSFISTEKLKVAIGTNDTSTAMTTPLFNDTFNTSIQSKSLTYTPSSSGTYYLGFQAHSSANEWYIYLDNISVTKDCAPPTVDGINVTDNGGNNYSFTPVNASGATTYDWYFGDGSLHAFGASVNHTFATSSNFTVTLVCTSVCGSATVSRSLELGIQDIQPTKDNLTIYPNPAKNNLTIKATGEMQMKHISVFNMMGQMVYDKNLDNHSNIYHINLSQFTNGIYAIHIKTTSGMLVKTFEVIK